MAAAAGLFNQQMTAAQAQSGNIAAPMDSSTGGTDGTSSSSNSDTSTATISANDFMTLLVTEMRNQDPTANTDPNEYINQLVEVNSLEQLIDINQTLSTALDPSSTSSSNGSSGSGSGGSGGGSGTGGSGKPGAVDAIGGGVTAATNAAPYKAGSMFTAPSGAGISGALSHLAPGNLSIPDANPSAQKVAHALDGHRYRAAGSISPAR